MDETVHPEAAQPSTAEPEASEASGTDVTTGAVPAGDVTARDASPGGATVDEEPQHDCQVPREDAPEVGGEWKCPECGTWWRLESAEEHPEHLPERRDQRVNWYRVGKRAE